MVPLELFKDRNFSGTSFSIVLLSFTAGGLLLALTQYLQFVLGYSPLKAGLALDPVRRRRDASSTARRDAGQEARRPHADRDRSGRDRRAASRSCRRSPSTTGYGLLIVGLMVMGIGGGLAGPAAYTLLMQAVPAEHRGVGSAMNDTVQQTGARAVGRRTGQCAGRRRTRQPAGLGPRGSARLDRRHPRSRPRVRGRRPRLLHRRHVHRHDSRPRRSDRRSRWSRWSSYRVVSKAGPGATPPPTPQRVSAGRSAPSG